jgi:tetratricopeptide (TPR) repeat protein
MQFIVGGDSMDEESGKENEENVDELSEILKNTGAFEGIFKEPMELLKEMYESFEKKSFTETIEDGKRILEAIETPVHEFQRIGMAVSISAASQWATALGEVGVETDQIDELINQAREHFTKQDFKEADQMMQRVREMIPKFEQDQKQIAQMRVSSAKEAIEEVEAIGADMEKAQRALEQAENFLEVENFAQVAHLTEEAKEEAENARKQRIQTTSDALLITRSVIEESKDIGVDTKEPESLFKKAKKAFGRGDFVECAELNKEAEELALKLQDEHMERVLKLKEKRDAMKKDEPSADSENISEEKKEEENTCPTCESNVRYVKKYDRYWCNECKKYTPRK